MQGKITFLGLQKMKFVLYVFIAVFSLHNSGSFVGQTATWSKQFKCASERPLEHSAATPLLLQQDRLPLLPALT